MLEAGGKAPEFNLDKISGGRCSLSEHLEKGPALIVFFKISCPTCHLSLPLLERLTGKPPNLDPSILGISQDDAESTIEFLEYFGITFPVLVDPAASRYPVSTEYGITFVPSLFLIASDRTIMWALHGFNRAEMAERLGADLFRETDNVPESKPGCGSKN